MRREPDQDHGCHRAQVARDAQDLQPRRRSIRRSRRRGTPIAGQNDAYRHMQRSGVSRLKLLGRAPLQSGDGYARPKPATRARRRARLCANTADSIPEGAGPAGQPSHLFHRRCACPAPPLQWDGDGGTMEDDTESTRLANERLTINLRRAFANLLTELKHAYGQPARDDAEMLSQYALALQAIARFLNRIGPYGDLAHFAEQFAKLAQRLQDVNEGVRVPMLYPAFAKRSDQTPVWLARAHVALAVETMQRCGHIREKAAKWAAKAHPELEQLITERGVHRSDDFETAIISWCEDFSSHKIRNEAAARAYSVGLDKLKAWAPNCNSDQMEGEADRLLQEAVALL